MALPQIQYSSAAFPQPFQGGGHGFGHQVHWQQQQQQKHLPTPPPAGPLLSTQPTRLPYAKSSKEPSQESDSVEVDMDGWQVAPPNLGKDDGDSNNTDDFDHFLDHAANCVGGNYDNTSENTHMSSDTEF